MTKPPSLIAIRLGQEQAAQLSRIVGGTQVVVPIDLASTANNSGRLRARVGEHLFVLLVLHFGGTRLYVPQSLDTCRKGGVDIRKVDKLTKRGWSATRIARELKCSDRTIFAKRRLIRSRAGGSPKNGNDGSAKHGD